MVKNSEGKIALDYARENEKLENSNIVSRLEKLISISMGGE